MLCLFQRQEARASISSSLCWVILLRCRDGRVTAEVSTQRVREPSNDGFSLLQCDFEWKDFAFVFSADDTTGIKSIYTVYQGHELMFHVSTMLPYSKENKQQVGGWLWRDFFVLFYKEKIISAPKIATGVGRCHCWWEKSLHKSNNWELSSCRPIKTLQNTFL